MRLAEISAKHTKINKIEKLKETRSYKDALEALEVYAKEGYDSILKEDMDYFLKCFGVFDRPATPKKFMMRVRIPYGRLTSKQAFKLGELSKEYGNNYMDLTTRAQIQYRYLDIENIPHIISELESVGITSWQTGVDNFRNIVSDPLNGVGFDNIIDVSSIIEQMHSIWLKKDEWIATLPRKFNTSISGSMTNRCNLFAHDCCFALAMKDGEYGFNLYLGGRVGAIAKSADIFVTEDEVIELYEAVIKMYKEYGFKDSRNKNRLHFLIKEAGMEAVVEAIKDVAKRDFKSAGITMVKQPRVEERDGRIRLKDGSYALHLVVPSGIFSGESMIESANVANEYGDGILNISTTQNLFVFGINGSDIDSVKLKKPFSDFSNYTTPYFNQMVACAGIDLCPFGVIPNKADAIEMSDYLSQKVPLPSDASVRMHWSACVKGCGVHELGDIGFVGAKVKVDGKSVYGVHIQIGGKATSTQEEAYTIIKSVPLTTAKYYVANLVEAYRDLRNKNESFENFESRVFRNYSKGAIEFILRWNIDLAVGNGYEKLYFEDTKKPNLETNEIFEFGLKIYKNLTGTNAYQGVHMYNPIERTPAKHPVKLNPSIDKRVGDVVMKMIAPSGQRYEVFTEVLKDIANIVGK